MSLYSKVFGEDPMRDWPAHMGTRLEFSLDSMTLSGVGFGAGLADVKKFGRPTSATYCDGDRLKLCNSASGFYLELTEGKLGYFAFLIAPGPFLPCSGAITFCEPLMKMLGKELVLTKTTDQHAVTALLGEPRLLDVGNDTILFYEIGTTMLEFEFFAKGCLKRWNLSREMKRCICSLKTLTN